MGHKTHPIGFRLGVIKGWQSRWFAGNAKDYSMQVMEDWKIREVIRKQYAEAGISRVEIERSTQDLTINVHTARPGIVIGRGGQRVDELRKAVEGAVGGKRVRLNVLEIRQPELDAYLVARNVADQLERRVMFRRAIRQAVMRSMQAGAKGIKVMVSGRLGGAEIARNEKVMDGRVSAAHAPRRYRLRACGSQHDYGAHRREGLGVPRRHTAGQRSIPRAGARGIPGGDSRRAGSPRRSGRRRDDSDVCDAGRDSGARRAGYGKYVFGCRCDR